MPNDNRTATSASFVVIGAGGLGCPALLGLVAGGAQHITLIDPDVVETSNLQRQVLYTVGQVGMAKVNAAARSLQARSPTLQVIPVQRRLRPEDVDEFVTDLPSDTTILECTDAPNLKFALNDACIAANRRLVIGAAIGMSGQAMLIEPGAACYRCIYETPPRSAATCNGAGVLGVTVGVTGSLMATLALNPKATPGQLWVLDLFRAQPRPLHPRPRDGCPACAAIQPSVSSPNALDREDHAENHHSPRSA